MKMLLIALFLALAVARISNASKEMPTQEQNLQNLNVIVIGLGKSASNILKNLPFSISELSNLIANSCSDSYANGIANTFGIQCNAMFVKLNDASAILNDMAAPLNLQTMVQKEISNYQNLVQRLNQSNTNSATRDILNSVFKAFNNTITVTVSELNDYIKQNASGLLGLPVNTFQCLCFDRLIDYIRGNKSCDSDDTFSVSDLIDPSDNEENGALYELENAVLTANESCVNMFSQLLILEGILVALKEPRCNSDYKSYLVGSTQNFFTGVKIKLLEIQKFALKLNLAEINEDLQEELNSLATINASITDPNVSNGGVSNAYYQLDSVFQKCLTETFPKIANYIDENKKVSRYCFCVSSVSGTLFGLAIPIFVKILDLFGALVANFSNSLLRVLPTLQIAMGLFASLEK